ncbi:hypothetical protein GCM10008965_45570 [Methylorubrum aminovorans]
MRRSRSISSSSTSRSRAHATQRREACLRAQAFEVIAGRQEKLGGAIAADGVAGHEVRRKLVDDGADHGIEIGDLVVQFRVAPRQGLQADPVGSLDVAVGAQIGPPRRQGPHELHPGHPAQRLAQAVGRAHDGVVDHLQGDAPSGDRGLPARVQDAQRLDHAVAGARRDGTGAGEGRVRCTLGVEVVVLASPPPILDVGGGHLQHLDPSLLQEAEQAGAIAAGRLDPDAS